MKNKFLLLIISLAAILRLWNLGEVPPSLTSDEAALGYNAYSILKTGRDEYGQLLPLVFKSFGDYKPGLYVYVDVPFVAFFGLNEFSTRLPGAISGIVAVWLLYLITRELFKDKKLEILAAALLAVSPWHILFSRGAWEVNLSLTLTLTGIYFFLRALRDKTNLMILSAVFFALTLLSYQGAKLSTGIVILSLGVAYHKNLFKFPRRTILTSFAIGVIVCIPIILSIFQGKAGRLEVFNVFSYPRPQEVVDSISEQGNESKNSITYTLFHSEPLFFARSVLGRWMNHYSTRFLVFEGDWGNPRHSIPNMGLILILDGALLVLGLVALSRFKEYPGATFILLWFLVAPLPSALSRDAVHAVRAFNMVIPLIIIVAFGAAFLWDKVMSQKLGRKILSLIAIIYALNFLYFLESYFIHLPVHDAKLWEFGYKEAVQTALPIQQNYKNVVFVQSYDQPYIYYLFYSKYDPKKYQQSAKLTEGLQKNDVGFVEGIDNMRFEWIDWPSHRGRRGVLFLGTPEQIPPNDSKDPSQFKLLKEIKYPDGKVAFRLVEVL